MILKFGKIIIEDDCVWGQNFTFSGEIPVKQSDGTWLTRNPQFYLDALLMAREKLDMAIGIEQWEQAKRTNFQEYSRSDKNPFIYEYDIDDQEAEELIKAIESGAFGET